MTTTAMVTANRAWLTDPLDPGGASVVSGTVRTQAFGETEDGELVVFAGFRTELASYDSVTASLGVRFEALTAAQVTQLRAWKGRTLLLRTADGQRFYGGFLAVSMPAYMLAGPLYAAEVTFQIVSFTDAV